MEQNKEIKDRKRKNAKLYPIYKMFAWDLLCFYSIEFLFYTITKRITPAEVLIINGFYLFSKIIMQIPAVTITDFFGRKKGIIFGNILICIYLLILIIFPGAISIIIANLVFALGYNIKEIAETNILYDSVSTKGGEGLYSKIDARGGSFYYILDGATALVAGYLFVINNYLPMFVALGFCIISTILSFRFEEIYPPKKKEERKGIFITLKEYRKDLKTSVKFIFKSKRMKSYMLFSIVIYSLISIIDIYRGDLLVEIRNTRRRIFNDICNIYIYSGEYLYH